MEKLLQVVKLKKYYRAKKSIFGPEPSMVKAVDGVDFCILKGRTLGIIGESGCGKSTLGRSLLRLIEPTEGEVYFEGVNILKLSKEELLPKRREMQIVFQDPFGSLNPRMSILATLSEPLIVHHIGHASERLGRVESLIESVGLKKEMLGRYPHEFSGGQRQRIGIARALALNPKFIVADEPVSSLDVSIQSQILNLIIDLQQKFALSFLFISHDLAVVQHVSHDVAIMYSGKIVEKTTVERLFRDPRHPYTRHLFSLIPSGNPHKKIKDFVRRHSAGQVPAKGCSFSPRCSDCESICPEKEPALINIGTEAEEHWVRCHLYGKR